MTAPEADGTTYPWVYGWAGQLTGTSRWHKRPLSDGWDARVDRPQARTVCGLSVFSTEVATTRPRPRPGLRVCPACVREGAGQ